MSTSRQPSSLRRLAVRVILSLYPRRLREAHGGEMEDMVLSRLARAEPGGRLSVLAAWLHIARDLVVTRFSRGGRPPSARAHERLQEKGMHQLFSDLRYALRRLGRTPVFTAGALAIMAIAIGANTTVFTVVNHLLLRPPPYEQPERVVNIYQHSDDGEPSSTSFPAYRDMAAMEGLFEAVSATSPSSATLDMGDGPQNVSIEFTTASFLNTIGRSMTRGRWFDAPMDQVGAGNFAVVSHHAWLGRFGSDPSIVGRTLLINGNPVTVTGVGPEGVNGIGRFVVTDLFMSISSVGVNGPFMISNLDRRQDHWYDVKARLAEGVTIAQAQQAMDGLARSLATQFPDLNEGRDITVFRTQDVRLSPEVDGNLAPAAAVLMAVVGLVLLLACANLGGLLLVRGVTRGSEVAVRRALGARPSRVASLFLGEAMLLSVGGGLLGMLLAHWLLGLLSLVPLPGPLSGNLDLSWDLRVLGFSVVLMIGTGIFFGLAPALQSLKADVAGILREDPIAPGRSKRQSLMRNGLVALQVAVSMILIAGAGVTVRSLVGYSDVDPGVDVEQLAFVQTNFTQAGFSAEEFAPLFQELEERIAGIPGVTAMAVTSRLPVQGGGSTTTVIEDYQPTSGTGSVELDFALVSPGYFDAVGVEVRAGRSYVPEDQFGDERIVVVNEAAAEAFWGGGDAINRRIRPEGRPDSWVRVVGVVSDSKVRSLSEPPRPLLYYLMSESSMYAPYFVVRSGVPPESLLSGLRDAFTQVNSRLPVTRLGTMESHLGDALVMPRMSAGLLGLFSFLALCLAAVGVYTIVSFAVAGRRREVGIRVALGAARGEVIWTVVSEVAWTVAVGVLVGGALVFGVSTLTRGFGFGADLLSLSTLAPALLILITAVGLGSLIPAWRAVRVDPAEALRGS